MKRITSGMSSAPIGRRPFNAKMGMKLHNGKEITKAGEAPPHNSVESAFARLGPRWQVPLPGLPHPRCRQGQREALGRLQVHFARAELREMLDPVHMLTLGNPELRQIRPTELLPEGRRR